MSALLPQDVLGKLQDFMFVFIPIGLFLGIFAFLEWKRRREEAGNQRK